jgi:hypothetical protein
MTSEIDASQRNDSPLLADELRQLLQRSDAEGLVRLAGHLALIGVAEIAETTCVVEVQVGQDDGVDVGGRKPEPL